MKSWDGSNHLAERKRREGVEPGYVRDKWKGEESVKEASSHLTCSIRTLFKLPFNGIRSRNPGVPRREDYAFG
jgi:hypothetical protein